MELKKPTTYEEQVYLIREKGFIIADKEEEKCVEFLSRTNYYRLSAYYIPFFKQGRIEYNKVHFKQVQSLYEFDGKLRNLISYVIEDIEVCLRTKIAYHMAHSYGPIAYMDGSIYNNSLHNHKKFLGKVNKCAKNNENSLAIQHHNSKYEGQYPIWMIIEYFSIGMLSYFYADLITKDRKTIARELGSNDKVMDSWLKCITVLRNKCAHYSRLYDWSFTSQPTILKDDEMNSDRTLYTQLYVLKKLYPVKEEWNTKFVIPLQAIVSEYENDIHLEDIGFPDDWDIKLWN